MALHGFHGTSREIATRVESGDDFTYEYADYHWLGNGVYFFAPFDCEHQAALDRAEAWARQKYPTDPAVVQVEIDERDQLDLWEDESAQAGVRAVYDEHRRRGAITVSQTLGSGRYFLDRYVVDSACDELEASGTPVATVKGLFEEYPLLYPTCAFLRDPHIQVMVRDQSVLRDPFVVWTA
jgi:hypothetical protein